MPAIKSSGPQFCKPDLASETVPKPMKWAIGVYDFSLQLFGRPWSSNGVRMTRLRPFYGYNLNGFQHQGRP
jgi:hypothetical protein